MLFMFISMAAAAPFPKWGLGATAQTNLYPFGYPLSLPSTSVADSNPKNNMQTTSFVGSVGGKFLGYLSNDYRGAIRPIYSFGGSQSGFSALSISVELERVLSNYNGIEILAGGGLGTGGFQFDQGEDGRLSGRTLYLRAKGSALMPSAAKTTAWELGIFAELGIVGEERYEHNDVTYTNGGFFNKDEAGSLGWGIYYPILGVELTGYIGRFGNSTSSRKKRRRNTRRPRR